MKKKIVSNAFLKCCMFLLFFHICINWSNAQMYSPSDANQMLIRFEPGTSPSYINAYKASLGAVEVAISPVSQVRLWYISSFSTAFANHGWTNINETTNGSKDKAGVNSVGLNFETTLPFSSFGSMPPSSWNPTAACPNFSIFCTTSNKHVKVAILDTGIGYTGTSNNPTFCNPQLFGSLYSSYIGHDFVNNDNEPQDDQGHGTHVTGIIAQIAHLADISNIELLSYKTHNSAGVGDVFDIILAIDQAILDGANMINMSFSYQAPPPSSKPEPLQQAIDVAGDYGLLVLAAAGNVSTGNIGQNPPFFYPASFPCPNIISVASVNCNSQLSSFSAWGFSNVDIAMLGENIIGPHFITGAPVFKSGTSQATAIVTGIAAELASHQGVIDYIPLRCSILDGAQYKPTLEGLIATEGVAHANQALTAFQNGTCLSATDQGTNLAVVPELIYESEQLHANVSVSPNPFTDEVAINFTGGQRGEAITLMIYDAIGALLYTEKSTIDEEQGKTVFNWRPDQRALSGFYVARVQTAGKTMTYKLIKN